MPIPWPNTPREWTRPSNERLTLRCFARRIDALTGQKAAANDGMDTDICSSAIAPALPYYTPSMAL
jgi:hypothetical protein